MTMSCMQIDSAVRARQPLHVTFTNGGYTLLMQNWAAHMKRLGLPHVVVALDKPALDLCQQHGVLAIPWDSTFSSGLGTGFRPLMCAGHLYSHPKHACEKHCCWKARDHPYQMSSMVLDSCFESLGSRDMCCRNFRENMTIFRQMGAIKPAIVLWLFERYALSTVVLSDTDTVWLRDPAGEPLSGLQNLCWQ
jgi:hypothetical protein